MTRRRTILVVEDDVALRDLIGQILEGAGYDVLDAADVGEADALASTRRAPIDAVLIDVVTPESLGGAVVSHIRGVHPDMKVLYMSGYAHPVLRSLGTITEEATLISKPFDAPSLLAKLREVFDD